MRCRYCEGLLTSSTCQNCGATAPYYKDEKSEPVLQQPAPVHNININMVSPPTFEPIYYNQYNQTRTSSSNKMTIFILCILLGWLGVHRFAVGKSGTGIIYLFTGGLFMVGCLVDAILIITGNFRDSQGLPIK